MRSATTITADVLLTATILVAACVLATLLVALRRVLTARWGRPHLPAADRPPAGLGRLVPVGEQVDQEYRRGVAALEHWLLSSRQVGRGGT